jgi:PAS domain S-box-containing protein
MNIESSESATNLIEARAGSGRSLARCYAIAFLCFAIALLLRWILEPIIKNNLPLVTLYGAVAVSVWYSRWQPAAIASLLGYVVAHLLFISSDVATLFAPVQLVGFLTYAISAGIIIYVGERMHRAKDQIASVLDARKHLEQTLATESELLTTTLASIGDAVVVTDTEGRITSLNPEAERLTGWKNSDSLGKPLPDVFRIVDERTRQPAEDPVHRALREGVTVGLANHTVLISKDGREIPIDDSAAPIRDTDGSVFGVVLIFRDVTAQRRAHVAREQLAAIVEYSGEALATKNLDGIIQTWNASAEKLFGYKAEEIVGKPVTTIIPPDRLSEEEEILSRIRRGLPAERLETIRVTKDGRRIPVSLTVSPLKDSDGNVIGASKLIQDITERKRLEEARQQMLVRERSLRAQAESAGRMKDEFLATVSHELRTPLNAILGWATTLNRTKLDDLTERRGMEAIERNARAQAQLIEDLLDVSRIISGKMRLDVKPVVLTPIVEAAIDSVRPAADAKSIRIALDIDPDANHLRADEGRLQQIIWNLLSNSIKFTPPGGYVQVKIKRTPTMAEITVSDTGEGIEREFLPFVFDRFQQADSSVTRRHGGLGLGLAITRHLVEMHGGTIEAQSEGEGRGARFIVKLPTHSAVLSVASTDSPADGQTTDGADGRPNLGGVRILAVDDSRDTRELITVVLETCGANVTTAALVREALDVFAGWKPDVLICDIGMPEEDGYALIRTIRDLPPEQGGKVPAIALTGYVRVEDRMRALEAGYQMFVPKPIEAGELRSIVATVVGRGDNDGKET